MEHKSLDDPESQTPIPNKEQKHDMNEKSKSNDSNDESKIHPDKDSPRNPSTNLLRGLRTFGENSSAPKTRNTTNKSNNRTRIADAITTAHRRKNVPRQHPAFKTGHSVVIDSYDKTLPNETYLDSEISPINDKIEPVSDTFDLDLGGLDRKQNFRGDTHKPAKSGGQPDRITHDPVNPIETVIDMGNEEDLHVSPGEIDRLAVIMIEELMLQVTNHIYWTYHKAYFYKFLEKLFYLTLQGINTTCSILGFMLGSSGNESSQFFFIIGVLNAVGVLLFEVNDRYKFEKVANKLFKCTQDFEEMKTELRELKVSACGPLERLDIIRDYEKRLNKIEMDAFNSQTFKVGHPTEFNSCTGDVDYFTPIKPDDIPVDIDN